MDIGTYKRVAVKTFLPKEAKAGVRTMLRKKNTVSIARSIIGLKSSVDEFMLSMRDYLVLGGQLKPEAVGEVKEVLKGVLYHTVILAKELKVKLPTSTKKLVVKGALTTAVFDYYFAVSNLLKDYGHMYGGLPFDLDVLKTKLEPTIPALYALVNTITKAPVSEILDEGMKDLTGLYPELVQAALGKKAS